MDVGAIENFDVTLWTKLANFLTAYDEPLMALEVLKKLPGYYRDNVPAEIIDLTSRIQARIATPTFYANNIEHDIATGEQGVQFINGTLRGKLIHDEVKALNDKGFFPHIFELAPGPYCLPLGLRALGLRFSYCAKSLNPETVAKARLELGSMWSDRPPGIQKNIFIACEIIEHLHYVDDIAAEYYRYGMKADFIHISTPLYTFDGRASSINWEDKDLGHLRTYTPDEFVKVVLPMFFPNDFSWQLHKTPVMHLRGEKNGNKFL